MNWAFAAFPDGLATPGARLSSEARVRSSSTGVSVSDNGSCVFTEAVIGPDDARKGVAGLGARRLIQHDGELRLRHGFFLAGATNIERCRPAEQPPCSADAQPGVVVNDVERAIVESLGSQKAIDREIGRIRFDRYDRMIAARFVAYLDIGPQAAVDLPLQLRGIERQVRIGREARKGENLGDAFDISGKAQIERSRRRLQHVVVDDETAFGEREAAFMRRVQHAAGALQRQRAAGHDANAVDRLRRGGRPGSKSDKATLTSSASA